MSIVIDRKDIDCLTGWSKVKALRAKAESFEILANGAPGSLCGDYRYAAGLLTREANVLSTQLSGVQMVASPSHSATAPRATMVAHIFLAPIRYLRTLFRRLEKATRPPENC
jgi:hypothetical protein